MRHLFRFIITSVAAALIAVSVTAGNQGKTLKILAIGNSFSHDAVEQNLWELFNAEGIDVIIGNLYIPGCPLEKHYNNSVSGKDAYSYRKVVDGVRTETKGVSLEKGLLDEKWDYVSFQQSSGISGLYETYEPFLKDLIAYIDKTLSHKPVYMFHQTWAYSQDSDHGSFPKYDRDQMKMYSMINAAVRQALEDNPSIKILIPSGTAIQNGRTSYLGDRFNRDGYHLDLTFGRYTAACAWFEAISKKDVRKNPYYPPAIDEKTAKVCREAAHNAVRNPWEVTPMKGEYTARPAYLDPAAPESVRVEDLLSRMTLHEKVMQLNQYTLGRNTNVNNIGEAIKDVPGETGSVIYFEEAPQLRNALQKKAVEHTRLGIPLIYGFDVIHGFRTLYQISLGQACSWNPELVEKACSMAAMEARRSGIDWTFSPMIDVARDPRWGRVAEGYGEDPYTNGVFAEASVRGYQGTDLTSDSTVASCLKHYVGYGASEAGRDYVYTEISRQTLWDTYLYPYERGIRAGAQTVMSAFNDISGTPASANRYTLTEILREKWGFDGLVVSDWGAVQQLMNQGYCATLEEAGKTALEAGVDMDMMSHSYDKYLEGLVESGKLSISVVDEAVRRVLRVKFRLGLFENPYTAEVDKSARLLLPESLEVAGQLAAESMVLLKNENNTLPLENVSKIAVIGPLAQNSWDLMGNWKAHSQPEDIDIFLNGIEREFKGRAEVRYAKGCDVRATDTTGFSEAVSLAEWSDAVVLCLGEMLNWSGENTSRTSIALPAGQEALAAAVKRTGKPVIITLTNGRPLELCRLEKEADAIIETWQPGTNGASALAGIISGRINPSGRLSITFPYSGGQIPIYYDRRKSARRGDQGLYKDITSEPLYWFGHGLSYTEYSYSELRTSATEIGADEKFTVEVDVTNTGSRDGLETVHWFISDPWCSVVTRPEKELRHFSKQHIKAGETVTYKFEVEPARDLSFITSEGKRFVEPGEYRIMAGGKSVSIRVK